MSRISPFFKDVTLEGTHAVRDVDMSPASKPSIYTCEYSEKGVPNLVQNESAKRILIIAGVHGNEHNAVLAACRLYHELSNETYESRRVKHDIRFLIGVNRWGLLANKREWGKRTDVYPDPMPEDGEIDFNRVWTERQDPEINDSATHMRQTIMAAIDSADVVIDVHNSPACDNMVLLNNDDYVVDTIKFLNACHMPNYMVWESTTNTIKKWAIEHGKTAFTVELGGMTIGPHDGAVMIDQVAFLKTLVSWVDEYMPVFNRGERLPPDMLAMPIYSRAFGIIDEVKMNHYVEMKKGEVFATMMSDGGLPEDLEFKAPCDGRLVCCEPARVVKPGDEVFTWQPTVKI